MAELVLNHVYKQYGNQEVVSDLSLVIPEGAFTALLGPSGCGKTTTLRMLAGLETISSGQLILGERLLADETLHSSPESRNMSMVFQSYALWPHMTVAENIGYPLKIQKVKGKALQQQVKAALEIVELGAYAQRAPQELSGGQRQRVALARCLVSDPEVVLLDEPLANLDRHLRTTMEDTFREFHRRTGATFVYVTHDQAEAMALATHIAVMDKGRLMQWGQPDELYQRPENTWTASFIGQGVIMNFPIMRDTQYLTAEDLHAALDNTQQGNTPVLVRPQHVVVSDMGISARVDSCIYQGERYLLTLSLMDGQRLLAFHHKSVSLGSIIKVTLKQGWAINHD